MTENVGALRSGITAARQQAQDSFTSANEIAREQSIERKVRRPERILEQSDFPLPVSAEAAQQWDGAFEILDSYAAALQTLVDPQRAQETSAAIGELGASLNGPTIDAKIPPGLTAVFQTLGQALVQASAERKATDVMRATDPAFNNVISQMATAIGRPEEPGTLANTVASQWNRAVLPRTENDYATLSPADQADRRRVIEAYTGAMAQRDKQLSDLMLLQQSLLAIGEAHSAAARGQPGDALFWIARVNGWADDVRKRLKPSEEQSK